MGTNVERLETKLTQVRVAPHTRVVNGKVVKVDGYWRSLRGRRVTVKAVGQFNKVDDYDGVLERADELVVIRQPGGTVMTWHPRDVRSIVKALR